MLTTHHNSNHRDHQRHPSKREEERSTRTAPLRPATAIGLPFLHDFTVVLSGLASTGDRPLLCFPISAQP